MSAGATGPGAGRLLVVNAGSSSLKLSLLGEDDRSVAGRHVEDWDGRDVEPVRDLVDREGPVGAVGHRVVHGGPDRSGPVRLDDDAVRDLRALASWAPLHQGRSVAGIDAARTALPDVDHVACFDTAYHTTLPDAAATYALPADWRRRWPLRRFGFHGLSHAHAARRAAATVAPAGGPSAAADLRTVTCHLGAGASLCASRGVRAVDTTMGFTPLEGLVMATRAGTVDPGLVLWLVTEAGLPPEEVRDGLEHRAGLQGLAGTSDMARVVDRRSRGDPDAGLAFDVYVHAVRRHVGAMAAALAGIDVLVFTGGVGERSPAVRQAVAAGLRHLGVAIDEAAGTALADDAPVVDDGGAVDRDVTAPGATASTLVVEAHEELEIARQVRPLLAPR